MLIKEIIINVTVLLDILEQTVTLVRLTSLVFHLAILFYSWYNHNANE